MFGLVSLSNWRFGGLEKQYELMEFYIHGWVGYWGLNIKLGLSSVSWVKFYRQLKPQSQKKDYVSDDKFFFSPFLAPAKVNFEVKLERCIA